MRLKAFRCLNVLMLIMLVFQTFSVVYADVPAVLEIRVEKKGDDTVLYIDVRHRSPSSSHYVDVIEIELDDKLEKLDSLEEQKSDKFTESIVIGPGVKDIQVRAHCNIHGWSSWVYEEKEESLGSQNISGLQYLVVLVGIILSMLLLYWIKSRN